MTRAELPAQPGEPLADPRRRLRADPRYAPRAVRPRRPPAARRASRTPSVVPSSRIRFGESPSSRPTATSSGITSASSSRSSASSPVSTSSRRRASIPGPMPFSSRTLPARTIAPTRPGSCGSARPRGGRRASCRSRSRSARAARRRRRAARQAMRCPPGDSLSSLVAPIVIPFRGLAGKQRIDAPEELREQLALAMLGDVVSACVAADRTLVVTRDDDGTRLADELGAELVDDPGAARGRRSRPGSRSCPIGRRSSSTPIFPARSRATCARSRTSPSAAPSGSSKPRTGRRTRSRCRGPSSSRRSTAPAAPPAFATMPSRCATRSSAAAIPNLVDDVDTRADLERVALRVGPRTQAALGALREL